VAVLRGAVSRLLGEAAFAERASALAHAIAACDGVQNFAAFMRDPAAPWYR